MRYGYHGVLAVNRGQPGHIVASDIQTDTWTVVISHDAGVSFDRRDLAPDRTGAILAIGLDPSNDRTVYVGGTLEPGGSSGGRLFKTTDGGLTWSDITGAIAAGSVDEIEVGTGDPGIVVVRAGSSLFRSFDAGASWIDITPAGGVSAVRVNPGQAGEIYAAVAEDLLVSEDGGTTWTSIGTGLGGYPVRSIDLVPGIKMLYAGTSGGGVYRNRLEAKYMLTISASPTGTTEPPAGGHVYDEGATIDISAIPAAGYAFMGWTGDATGAANPLRLTVNSDMTVKPLFRLAAPAGFSVAQIETRSLLMRQYINVLTWRRSANDPTPTAYKVYLLGDGPPAPLASPDAKTFLYWHRGVVKGLPYRYGLAAVGPGGIEGELAVAEIGTCPPVRRQPAKATQKGFKPGRLKK